MTDSENPAPEEQSEHRKAMAKHAKKRAAQQTYRASPKGLAKEKPPKKLISRSLEPRLTSGATSAAERKRIHLFEKAQRRADNKAALARPTVLTPLQIKRMERTKSGRAYMEKVTGPASNSQLPRR